MTVHGQVRAALAPDDGKSPAARPHRPDEPDPQNTRHADQEHDRADQEHDRGKPLNHRKPPDTQQPPP
ncbi:hypothetical protein [Streptomyces sp. NPDC003077]|uniref:hypothetical protein n=1 Tax=Streptomyces sp. NPDC003077 TaxID=3154443 RepID=UPI0033B06772